MSAKKFLIMSITLSATLVLIISTLFYYIDPLFYYRKTELYEPQYIGTERYQMAGLLRTMDYETLLTGTSMGRNFEEGFVDDKLNTKSFNASLPASTGKEQSMVVQKALREKEKLNNVIWELNYFSFAGEPDWVTGPPSDFPVYMYDQSKVNDLRYLFSSYTLEILYKNLQANKNDNRNKRNPLTIYKFGKGVKKDSFDRIEGVLSKIPKLDELPEYETSETMIRSFKDNVLSVIKDNPDTTFTFFFAPYSIYNQYIYYENHPDYLSERSKFKKEAYKLLGQYPNTELYDFQAMREITFNIDNYMVDGVHYYNFINRYIIDYIAKNNPIQSLADYERLIDQYVNLVKNFRPNQLNENTTIRESYQL
jgi:hypothetical protein